MALFPKDMREDIISVLFCPHSLMLRGAMGICFTVWVITQKCWSARNIAQNNNNSHQFWSKYRSNKLNKQDCHHLHYNVTLSQLPASHAECTRGSMEIYNNIVITTEITCNHCCYIIRGLLASLFSHNLTSAIQFDYFLFAEERIFRLKQCTFKTHSEMLLL